MFNFSFNASISLINPLISVASPGLIPVQPKDELSVGFDESSAAGDYSAPNDFDGTVTHLDIRVSNRLGE